MSEALAFAESVGGVLDRHGAESPELGGLLDELGWATLAHDQALVDCAGLGAVELGRRLAPVEHVDRLLGGGPTVGDLVRSLGPERLAVVDQRRFLVGRAEPVSSSDGLGVDRAVELGRDVGDVEPTALAAWTAASVGYLGGLGQGALDLTVGYVAQRRAFGSTLAALGPVQQLLAGAATAVSGVRLLAAEGPDMDALAHAGAAVDGACAACHQVTGAIGFTLEYPLHRYTQRARALAVWNDSLIESTI